ncbi:MAG: hypothetical protein IKI11_05420 [Neisseriaceae bacterium]|nr:hypothetical protein [Neisseriaceae bacterium]
MFLETTAIFDTLNGYFSHCGISSIKYYDNLFYVLSQNRFCSHCGCEHTWFISREEAKAELKHIILNTPILKLRVDEFLVKGIDFEYDDFLEKYLENRELPRKIIVEQAGYKLVKHDGFVELIYEIANDFNVIGKRLTFSDTLNKGS